MKTLKSFNDFMREPDYYRLKKLKEDRIKKFSKILKENNNQKIKNIKNNPYE